MAVVVKIIDGDPFIVEKLERKLTIRLWGVDTPEWDQPFSKEVKYFVSSKILQKKITILPYYSDEYGRLVAEV